MSSTRERARITKTASQIIHNNMVLQLLILSWRMTTGNHNSIFTRLLTVVRHIGTQGGWCRWSNASALPNTTLYWTEIMWWTPLSLAHRTCEKKKRPPKRELSIVSGESCVRDDDVMNKDDYCSQMIWYLLWIDLLFITLLWIDLYNSSHWRATRAWAVILWWMNFPTGAVSQLHEENCDELRVCDEWCYEIDNSSHLVSAVEKPHRVFLGRVSSLESRVSKKSSF